MRTAVVVVLVLAWSIPALIVLVGPRVFRRAARPPDVVVDRLERTEECECGAVLPVSHAHLIVAVEDDPESGGGWVQSAAFCAAHCPGGCNHEEDHEHADA